MTDAPNLGRRLIEPPVTGDIGQWAASEVTKHEELCGLRYEAIARDMAAMRQTIADGLSTGSARSKAIEDKIGGAIKWVMGIVAALAVALIMMFLNDTKTRASADESDKREMRARLSLLTTQLANVQQHTLVVTPPGAQATTVPAPISPPLDADELSEAAGSKSK